MAPLVGDVGGELLPPGSPGFTARTCTARSTAEATSALVSGSIRTAASGTLPAGPGGRGRASCPPAARPRSL